MADEQMITNLLDYDWIAVQTSGGKDSQCALHETVRVCREVGFPLDRVVAIHCDLGEAEWPGTWDLARQQAEACGVTCLKVQRRQGDLLNQIRERGMWPSATNRYCTSDQKRAQGRRVMSALTRALTGQKGRAGSFELPAAVRDRVESRPGQQVRILSVMGMRAAESTRRSKLPPLETIIDNRNQRVDVWLPIHTWGVEDVWRRIFESRVPYHWAYDLDGGPQEPRFATTPHPSVHQGMPRLSCSFCILAPREAAVRAGVMRPELLSRLVALEAQMGHDFRVDYSLRDVQADIEAGRIPGGAINTWEM